jgi:MFS family permease
LQLPEAERTDHLAGDRWNWGEPGVLAAAFLFNLGQGVLRPSLPLYLRDVFAANYRMVTLIPVVFGAGKWVANLPTGYLLDRLGRRRLMIGGLLLIAVCDVASAAVIHYVTFLAVRACAGGGWAMFATVATTALVNRTATRGRAVSVFLMAETVGLLVGSAAGGSLYAHSFPTSPFFFEAACMLLASAAVGWFGLAERQPPTSSRAAVPKQLPNIPGFIFMCSTNAAMAGIQTGVLVFLFPLYLAERAAMSPEIVGYLIALGVAGRLIAVVRRLHPRSAPTNPNACCRTRSLWPPSRDPGDRKGFRALDALERALGRRGRLRRRPSNDDHRRPCGSVAARRRHRLASDGHGYGHAPRPAPNGPARRWSGSFRP